MPTLYIRNRENTAWIEIGGTPGGGAPPSDLYGVPYVTIGNSGVTTAERALTAGAGILITDGGANALVIVGCDWGAVPSTIEPDDAAAPGAGTTVARINHVHAIVAAIAGAIEPDDAAAEGVATSFSRSDHQHAIVCATPASPSVDLNASAEGVGTSFARSDHAHQLDQGIAPTWTQLHIFTLGERVGAGGNYLDISAAGVLTLVGTAKRALIMRPDIDFGTVQAHGKPTSVTIGAFQGFSMPIYAADNEELFISHTVPGRWDEASDIIVHLLVALSAGEDVGDNFKFQLSWNHVADGDVIPAATHDVLVEQAVLAGRNAQYDVYELTFTLDYDVDTPDDIVAHDRLGMRLWRIDATNPDVSNEIIVLDWHLHYNVDKMFQA